MQDLARSCPRDELAVGRAINIDLIKAYDSIIGSLFLR